MAFWISRLTTTAHRLLAAHEFDVNYAIGEGWHEAFPRQIKKHTVSRVYSSNSAYEDINRWSSIYI